jgi:hypothetical protein
MIKRIISYFFFLININEVIGHGRMTIPQSRRTYLNAGINAPVYTCLGPTFQSSSTSMRCHDSPAGAVLSTYNAGDTIQVQWTLEAPHPGDCSIWLSYDTNVDAPQNWIKLKDFPGCFSPTGIDPPFGLQTVSLTLPSFLPSCEHCVLRWEWYAVQLVSNVEFYVSCADIKIINNFNNNCQLPQPTTTINGIEHLLVNLNDPRQKGCPFYNVYDINFRPPLNTRSRGPREWIPTCNNLPTEIPPTQPPVVIYPCTNVNCGANGSCNNGQCVCVNGYRGNNCEIAPIVQCNINCKILNRQNCLVNNVCSNCLNGFTGTASGNDLCKIYCTNNCGTLNRRSCTSPNVCGVCLDGFTEPVSLNKMDSCVSTVGNIANGDISLSVTSQWKNGFCGRWVLKCPVNRQISFIVPDTISNLKAWNILNLQKIGNKIIGNCPLFTRTGQITRGGLCASHNLGQRVVSSINGFYFDKMLRNRILNDDITSNNYQNVSLSMNIKTDNLDITEYDAIMNTVLINSYGTSIDILNSEINIENNGIDVSAKIICNSEMEFDSALFLHLNEINSMMVDENLFYTDPIIYDEGDNQMNSASRIKNNLIYITIILIFFF